MSTDVNGDVVYVIPVEGMIEQAFIICDSGEASQESAGCKRQSHHFQNGYPGRHRRCRQGNHIHHSEPRYPYLYLRKPKMLISAGAIIALGTDHIYMAPGSVIGAATPMMMSPIPMSGPQTDARRCKMRKNGFLEWARF